MLPRQYALCSHTFWLALGSVGLSAAGSSLAAQTASYPAVATPQVVAPGSLPSAPAASKPQKPQTVSTPAQAPPQTPATPIVPARVSPNPSGQSETQQTTSPSPLDTPSPAIPAQGAPAAPTGSSLDTPNVTPGQPASQQPTPGNPLEQPVTVQRAAPPPVTPVEIAPPAPVASLPAMPTDYPILQESHKDYLGSTYIPVDSWVYPAALRLYSMGYLDSAFISMRPWTRRSLLHMLEKTAADVQAGGNEQAQDIYARLMTYVQAEVPGPAGTLSPAMTRGAVYGFDTGYSRFMGIGGLTLRDSFHLGQTIANDYGRPYQPGFNNITGFSSVNEWNRFSLYVRGEYQHAPAAAGYDLGLSTYLSAVDELVFEPPNKPQDTIPYGPLPAENPFRLQEAALSFHLLGHEISGGKSDAWLGPAQGGAMAWSNNAENIYSFRINRIEPMHIPYFSRIFGPLRYDFFVGSLKGHTFPNEPWVHSEIFSLRPTNNFEFAFQRTVIWGGKGHVPVTLHTFFRSFFSINDTTFGEKTSDQDPGARFSDFSFSWRLPFLRRHVTLYTDSIAHDDVTPPSAPRRAAYRPGLYLSQFPGIPKLDLRVEAASTDTSTLRSLYGGFNYFEGMQRQGYTNKGFIMGDWIGREAKGGQAWLTYHLSGNEFVQLAYLNKKTPKDFIEGGTTQNQFKLEVVKRLRPDIELDAWYQYEHWIAPVYKTNYQNDNVVSFQFTFYPKLREHGAHLNGK